MNRRITFLTILFVFTLGLIFTGCKKEEESYKKVRLKVKEPSDSPVRNSQNMPLHISIASVISSTESFEAYNDFIEYLGKKIKREVLFLQSSNFSEINNLVRYGHCEVAFVSDYAYIEGKKDFGMEILAVPQVNGKTTRQSYIIVPNNGTIKSFWDLEGKKFAFVDPLSSTGYLYPKYLLKQKGKKPKTFFSKTVFTYGHDNSVKALSQGLADGAAVDSLLYDFMVANDKIFRVNAKIVHKSPPFASPPVVINPAIDHETRSLLRNAFLSMHEDKEGKLILQRLMIDRFVAQKDKAYDSIRKIEKEIGY